MESIEPDVPGHSIDKVATETSLSSPETVDVCGSPQVNPRIGDEYQVEIPPMISKSEYLCLLMDPLYSEGKVDHSHCFLMGLPIPVTSAVLDKVKDGTDEGVGFMNKTDDSLCANEPSKSMKGKKYVRKKKGSKLNAESFDADLDKKELMPQNHTRNVAEKSCPDLLQGKTSFYVPGSQNDPWSEAEVDSFILGLFIFGKNFVQIQRFVDNKAMGNILSFYYGEFYRSTKYQRWSETRKTRRRKCVFGTKIFRGWRQQELLSRLHPHILKHSETNILEVSAAFTEGKVSLEDYVSNLKATVGIQVLVEAIGIGKGKEDLTCISMEPSKTNPLFPVCPVGKACASLTFSEIIALLTGSLRLSKARRSDIFWEAIWPRLLAKGWHSEQATNPGYLDSKHHIVFLAPCVKKFSRRKLEKGNHYFECVSDVLDKVASEPKLIELEAEDSRDSSCNEEDGSVPNQDNPSAWKSPHYLKPRVSTCNPNLIKFTVVDSSSISAGNISEIRELRCSPNGLELTSFLTSPSRKQETFLKCSRPDGKRNTNTADSKEVCGVKRAKFTIVDTSLVHGGKSSKMRELRYSPDEFKAGSETAMEDEGDSSDEDSLNESMPFAADMLSTCGTDVNEPSECKFTVDSSNANKLTESLRVQNGNQMMRTIKHKFSRRSKPDHSINLIPLKRRRLTACSKDEMRHTSEKFFSDLKSKQMESALNSEEAASKLSLSSPAVEGGQDEEEKSANCFDVETTPGQYPEHQIPSLIDLNLPPAAFDSSNGEPVSMETEGSQGIGAENACLPSDSDKIDHGIASVDADPASKQLNTIPRRQSTRSRPLTTRALESLQCEFLNVKKPQQKKGSRVPRQEIAFSSPSRKARSKIRMISSCSRVGNSILEQKQRNDNNETCNAATKDSPADKIEESK